MADYAPNEFRGRYARPGELDTSMLETHSVQKRPEVPPNPNLKPHTPSTGTVESKAIPLRQSELNPNLKSPAPTTGIVEAKSLHRAWACRQTPTLNPTLLLPALSNQRPFPYGRASS